MINNFYQLNYIYPNAGRQLIGGYYNLDFCLFLLSDDDFYKEFRDLWLKGNPSMFKEYNKFVDEHPENLVAFVVSPFGET